MRATMGPASRKIKIRGLSGKHVGTMATITDLPTEMEIEINYTGHGTSSKGIVLDNEILPLILKALNAE